MKKTFNIVSKRKIFYTISSAIIILTFIVSAIFGVKVDIEFKGGTMISYTYTGDVNLDNIKSEVTSIVDQNISINQGQKFQKDQKYIEISFPSKNGLADGLQSEVTATLKEKFPDNNFEIEYSKDVKPSIGGEFFKKCLVALVLAIAILIIYIGIRFKKIGGWSAGSMAIVALIHDCLIVYATFVFFRIPIDANFMAVLLTILGYSINDTIVIYDRVRENKSLLPKNTPFDELINTSVNQSLTRSLRTTISTVLVMVVVCIVALVFNVKSILSFSFPLIIGMISGVYSSICIATPLWVDWQQHRHGNGPSYAIKKK